MRKILPILLIIIVLLLALLLLQSCGNREAGQPEFADTTAVESTETKVDVELGIRDSVPPPAAIDTTPVAVDTSSVAALDPKAEAGKKLFANVTLGKIKVSCGMCHATKRDNRLRPGHALAGVTKRPSTWAGRYKGDALAKNAYGGMLCADLFMLKDGALNPTEVEALNAFLRSLETAPGAMTKALNIQWPAKPPLEREKFIDSKTAKPFVKAILQLPGDPAVGEKLFARACAHCHDIKEQRIAPPLADVASEIDYVVTSIRFGSGAMAFYAKDILSDQQIADIVAYIQSKLGQ